MKVGTIYGKEYFVFESDAEFEEHFKKLNQELPRIYDDWGTTPELSWTRSNDGCIVQVLKRGLLKARLSKKHPIDVYVRTIVGTFVVGRHKMDCDFNKHPCRYTVSGVLSYIKRGTIQNNRRDELKDRAFARILKETNDPIFAYKTIFPRDKPQSEKYIRNRVWALLANERVWAMIREDINSAAKALGITPEWMLKQWKDDIDDPELKPRYKQTAKQELGKILDMYPRDKKDLGDVTPFYQQISEAEAISVEGKVPTALQSGEPSESEKKDATDENGTEDT